MNETYVIPPNTLNSILTNDALYNMFKNDFESNADYFQHIDRNVYLEDLEKYICNTIANNMDVSYLKSFKMFYDDFILPKIEANNEYIFTLLIFKSLKSVYRCNKFLSESEEFLTFYNYIFTSSSYFEKCDEIINKIKEQMRQNELSIFEYQILTNYVKNSVDEYIPVDIACLLIKNHAFKYNHIFDAIVVKKIVSSLANDFMRSYGVKINIEYTDINLSKNAKTHDLSEATIYLDSILIDTFISGNYVELISSMFFKLLVFKDHYLLNANLETVDALKTIWRLVNNKVEIDKIFVDCKYRPYDYYIEMESNAFIMTLRFLSFIGIDLFNSYIKSQMRNVNLPLASAKNSPKEISDEMKFINRFSKMEKEKIAMLQKKFKSLSFFYGTDGKRVKAIEILNKCDNEHKVEIFKYLSSIIPEPICIIEDVTDLINQKFNDMEVGEFALKLIKYIYPDIFYYSLDSYLAMNMDKSSFNRDNYLSELYVRVSSIKEEDDIQKFLKSAINTIELMKQNG